MSQHHGEGALTHCRHERKIALPPERAEELARHIEQMSRIVAVPETHVTSVYFDLADGRLCAQALASPMRCLKVRTKEYDPDYHAPAAPRCVVEIKRRRGTITRKRRFWIARSELPAIFAGSSAATSEPAAGLAPAQAARRALAALWQETAALRPLVAVTYLRRVFPLNHGLRITFDRDIAFHLGPAELLLGPEALTRNRLPAPISREERVVVEVKHLDGAAPTWAAPLLAAQESGFSKFGAAALLVGRAPAGQAARASL